MTVRPRDLLPVLLVVGLTGFVGEQVAQGWRTTPRGSDGDARSAGPTVAEPSSTAGARRATLAASRRRLAASDAAGGYLVASLRTDSLLPAWPHEPDGRPLRIWVQPATAIRGWHPSLVADARRAFDAWRGAVPLRFAYTNDSARADVRVRWTARLAAERQVGHNRLDYTTDGVIVRAEVTLAVQDEQGEPLTADVRALTALHEVGHALGLGHSPDPADVMAARHPASARAALSAADLATARALYAR